MFSLLRRGGDPLEQRKTKQAIWKCTRRILDQYGANQKTTEAEIRENNRSRVCLPPLLQPFVDRIPAPTEFQLLELVSSSEFTMLPAWADQFNPDVYQS